jgi:hypothetical protein
MTPSLDSVEGLVVSRKLRRTSRPDRAAEQLWVADAKRHVQSAEALAASDPRLALAAAHDAIRKVITAHMDASCLRAQGGEGAHAMAIEYARYTLGEYLDEATLNMADGLRALRNQAEYSDLGATSARRMRDRRQLSRRR